MDARTAVLIVRGFAVREGRNKWACCYEIRMAGGREQTLVHRGELHGRAFHDEQAAIVAAREAGELEARRRIAAGLATAYTSLDAHRWSGDMPGGDDVAVGSAPPAR